MEYLVFRSMKSNNRVIIPGPMAMVIERPGSTVVYAIGGNGPDRMVWEVPSISTIHLCSSMAQAMAVRIPSAPRPMQPHPSSTAKDDTKAEAKTDAGAASDSDE